MEFFPVFVNHIADSVHPGEMRALFERHGVVIDVLILAEYGFVNMAREEEAHEAIQRVNGRLLHGQRLHVDYSEELKMFFSSQRIRFTSTLDPSNQMTSRHPPYPSGPQVESPFAQEKGHMNPLKLLDPETIDERLEKVNAELDRMRRLENEDEVYGRLNSRHYDKKPHRRRSRSQSRQRGEEPFDGSSQRKRYRQNSRSLKCRRSRVSLKESRKRSSSPFGNQPSSPVRLRSPWSPDRGWSSNSRERSRSPRKEGSRLNMCYEDQSMAGGDNGWVSSRGTTRREAYYGTQMTGRESREDLNRGQARSPREQNDLLLDPPEFLRRTFLSDNRSDNHLDEFDFFVGGLVHRVSSYDLAELFSRYGRITKAEPVKTFAFVNLETTEERAMAAVHQLSGTFQFENKIFVQFRKGSKYEHLNIKGDDNEVRDDHLVDKESRRQTRPSMSDDGIVIVGEFGRGTKSSIQDDITLISQNGPGVENQMSQEQSSFGSFSVEDMGTADQDKTSDILTSLFGSSCTPKEVSSGPAVRCKEPSSADLKLIMETIQSAEASKAAGRQPTIGEEGPKAQRKIHVSGLNSRVDNFDLKDLFGRYGQINRVDSKITYGTYTRYGFVFMFCSEATAVRCVCELDGLVVKGSRIKVSFMRGSYEDSKEFKEKWASQIALFNSREHKSKVEAELKEVTTQPAGKMKLSQIGEGLNSLDMSLSLEPLHPSYKKIDSNPFSDLYNDRISMPAAAGSEDALESAPLTGQLAWFSPQHFPGPGVSDGDRLTNVCAAIHSIQNKMILLEFFSPLSGCKSMAKLVPGQMYINGQQSLGFVIKSNAFHTWPKMVKDFLQIGRSVQMDARRLTEKEMHEGKDKEKTILWTSPLVWQPGSRPSEEELILTRGKSETKVSTAVVTQLHTSWGMLSHPQGDIVFRVEQMFWETAPLKATSSLLSDTEVEVGDRVAVHFRQTKPGETAVAGAPLTSLAALLVWVVASEVDPWVYYSWTTHSTLNFLATSSTLSRQLPGDSEADHLNLTGTVEEVHLPAGGVIKLKKEALDALSLAPGFNLETFSRVYFHRSRLYINGSKIQSDHRLDQELVPGDKVNVDLVKNGERMGEEYVGNNAGWVAVAVRCHTVVRGVHLAGGLREESIVEEYAEQDADTVRARVVYLKPPSEPDGPSTSGVAVLDSGEFLGQRVEFDREVCSAFGFSLTRADLSRVFGRDEIVFVKLKPYNSYCVEKLWLGFPKGSHTEGILGASERQKAQLWMENRGLSQAGLDMVVKGKFQPRLFLPLSSQQLSGQVVEITKVRGVGVSLTIKTSCGRILQAGRGVVFAFGWSLGKADLASCLLQDEQVLCELEPRYGVGEKGSACLVWLGGPGDRPSYKGLDTKPFISEIMDSHMKLWLAGKNMEMARFKSIVEGEALSIKSPSDKAEMVDQETLAQASILKKMKEQYGSEKMMTALMSMMQAPPAPPPPTSPPRVSMSQQQQRGYYSSGATTATYSSSPQPPSTQAQRSQVYPSPGQAGAQPYPPASALAQYGPQPPQQPALPFDYNNVQPTPAFHHAPVFQFCPETPITSAPYNHQQPHSYLPEQHLANAYYMQTNADPCRK